MFKKNQFKNIKLKRYLKRKEIDISVVIPVYQSELTINELSIRLNKILLNIVSDFEIIFVNDGSTDSSQLLIENLSMNNSKIKWIKLSRNFGQHAAITAGLEYALGRWIVVMDCDLQDIPEEISKLYEETKNGYDLVVARRVNRKDSIFKKSSSFIFFKLFGLLTSKRVSFRMGNFGIYSRQVIHNVLSLKEQSRSFGLFAIWVGFKRSEIDIEHGRRNYGESSYTFSQQINLAVNTITAYSNKLLSFSVQLGLFISFFSFIIALIYIYRYFFMAISLPGWTSLIVSIYFAAGLILACLGVMSLYIGKIFDEVKGRPLYIIESSTFES